MTGYLGTRMSRSSKILRNIASNWVGFAVSAAVTIILTPFVLSQLGEARYGVWVLTSSIVGYYGLLDLGFRSGVTQYLTRYFTAQDYNGFNGCISSAIAALSALSALIVLLSLGVAYLAPHVFLVPLSMKKEAFWCILIVGFSGAVQCVFSPFGAVFTATQRFDLANLIGVGTRLLMAGGIYVLLRMDYGLIGVSAASCGANLIDYLIRWRVAYSLVPQINISRRQMTLARLREVISFGAWNFLISVSSYVYLHGPALVIGFLMPIAAVGYYALATGLSRQIGEVLNPVGQVMYPAAVEMHVQNEHNALICLYRNGTRLMMLAAVCIAIIAFFWAEDFYRLWIGDKYLSGMSFHSVALLLQILLIGTIAGYGSNIAGQILLGTGQVRLLAILHTCGAIFNLIISLVLIHPYGLAGVAIAAVITIVLVELIGILAVSQRTLGLPIKEFLQACVRPSVVGLLLALLIICIRNVAGPAGNWLHLVLQGFIAGAGSVTLILLIGVTVDERQRFIVQPVRRLLKRVFPTPVVISRVN